LAGFDFWVTVLNNASQPGEDVRDPLQALARIRRARIVEAFITSTEYRRGLGRPRRLTREGSVRTASHWFRNNVTKHLKGVAPHFGMTPFLFASGSLENKDNEERTDSK